MRLGVQPIDAADVGDAASAADPARGAAPQSICASQLSPITPQYRPPANVHDVFVQLGLPQMPGTLAPHAVPAGHALPHSTWPPQPSPIVPQYVTPGRPRSWSPSARSRPRRQMCLVASQVAARRAGAAVQRALAAVADRCRSTGRPVNVHAHRRAVGLAADAGHVRATGLARGASVAAVRPAAAPVADRAAVVAAADGVHWSAWACNPGATQTRLRRVARCAGGQAPQSERVAAAIADRCRSTGRPRPCRRGAQLGLPQTLATPVPPQVSGAAQVVAAVDRSRRNRRRSSRSRSPARRCRPRLSGEQSGSPQTPGVPVPPQVSPRRAVTAMDDAAAAVADVAAVLAARRITGDDRRRARRLDRAAGAGRRMDVGRGVELGVQRTSPAGPSGRCIRRPARPARRMPNTKSESRFSYRESPDDGAARRVERSSQFEALRKKSGASFCPVSPLAVNPSFYVFSKTAQKSLIGNSQTLIGSTDGELRNPGRDSGSGFLVGPSSAFETVPAAQTSLRVTDSR